MATRYVWKKYNVSTKKEYYVSAWTTAFTEYRITSYYNTISLAAEYTINQSTGALELVSPTKISDKSVLLKSWESKPYMTSTNSNLKSGQVMHITNYKQTTGMYGVKNCYLWAELPTVSSRNVEICGSEIGSVQTASSSTYPTDGKHTDGYWYIYQGTVEVNTNPTMPGTPVLPEEIIAGENCSVSWTAATDAESAVSYKLEVSLDGGSWTQVYDGANRSYSYPVSSGTSTIAFRVKAYDDGGLESDYATSTTATVLTRTPIGDVPVGQSVFMNMDGVRTEFLVIHQGLPGTMYDSSCDGTWLLMKDIYESRAWDSTNNDYENSDIHSYLNNTFVNLFDSDIKSVIKQVKLPYTKGTGYGGALATGSSGLSAKVFLLSYTEVGFSGSSFANAEGSVLRYFNGAANSKRVAKLNGTATNWWLRSPDTFDPNDAWRVNSDGSSNYNNNVYYLYGVRPALVLPSTASIDSEYNIIAEESGSDTPDTPEEAKITSSAIVWGSYNRISDILVNIGGAWKNYVFGYANIDGVWKEFMNASGLPRGYTKLEYIESTGTQYIDTGYKPNNNTRLEVVYESPTTTESCVAGCDSGWCSKGFGIYVQAAEYGNYGNGITAISDTKVEASLQNGEVIRNGTTTITFTNSTFQTEYNMTLFALNRSGSMVEYAIDTKLYSCKIYENGVLVRDFVPCLNDSSTTGIWDKVEGKFYSNAGSGSFKYPGYVATGTPIGDVDVGSSVWINLNGNPTEFLVVHQGLPGTMYDSSCDGTWLLMKDIYESRAWNTKTDYVYDISTIHSYLNNTFINLFDSGIKSIIKHVKIPYGNRPDSSAVATGSSGLSAKIFLLSYTEAGFSRSSFVPIEGSVLSYFNGAANSKRVAKLNGTAAEWWLRSRYTDLPSYAWLVSTSGSDDNAKLVTNSLGVRPALVLPSETLVDSNFNVVV